MCLIDAKQSSCCNLWSVSPGMRCMRRRIRTRRLSMKLRRADLLYKESLQRLLVGLLGDPVWVKVAKEATSILKSSSGATAAPSHGFRYSRPKPCGNTRCFNCNHFGHMARECFFNRRPSQFTYRAPRVEFRVGKN